VADITYVETASGFVYTAFMTDLFSRRIAGWQVADTLRAELALDALEMAIWSSGDKIGDPLIHRSDRGVQLGFIRYAERLGDIGAVRSVGRKGDSYDNAAAESVNSLYKKELIDRDGPWNGVRDVTFATMEWVAWYNNERLHSACGYIPQGGISAQFRRVDLRVLKSAKARMYPDPGHPPRLPLSEPLRPRRAQMARHCYRAEPENLSGSRLTAGQPSSRTKSAICESALVATPDGLSR
jgi:transposase InsO family protein